jgi:polygalacturonase
VHLVRRTIGYKGVEAVDKIGMRKRIHKKGGFELIAFKQKCSLLLIFAMLFSLLPLFPAVDELASTAYADEVIPTAGLDLWLKADAGVTTDASGKVSQWADQSGKGNNLSQAVAADMPTFVTNAVYGKPAIRFPGDVNGSNNQFLSKQLGDKAWNGNSTVFMVMKQNSNNQKNAKGIFSTDIGSNIGAWSIVTSSNDPQRLMVLGPRDGGTSTFDLETASTQDPITLTVTIDTYAPNVGTIKSYRNGVLLKSGSNTYYKNFGSFKTYVIGKSYSTSNLNMAADVSEVLVYQGVLSDTDRQAVENYLMQKYYSVSPVVSNVPSGSAVMPGSSVALSSPTAGAVVIYTTDGTDPLTSGTSVTYSSPITISNNTTIKAAARVPGLTDSTVSTFSYTLASKLNPVTVSIPSGNVAPGTTITLSNNPGATIYFTDDGTDPKTSATKQLYTAPIPIVGAVTIRAYASRVNITDSDVASFVYTVLPVQPVTANRVSGVYFSGTQIQLTSPTAGVSIYYTMDGTDPKTSATKALYSSAITLNNASTLKAIATKSGLTDSAISQYDYTMYTPTSTVTNLPDSYYNRAGLENMPHLNYTAMPIANVKDFGAVGDGNASDLEAFDKAIAALTAIGGGVVYVPKGFYYFPFDLTDPANRWAWKRNYNNIHFIGDGDESVIRFKLPGIPTLPAGRTWTTRNGVFSNFAYGWRIDGNDISYKDLAFSWYPRYDARGGAGGYSVATTGNNIQMNRVTIDQGNIGAVFWQGATNIYVVDTQVRNTAADSIHFANVANVVAAYNFVDGANDDSIAGIDDKGYIVNDNHHYLYNTILNSYWGRGITATGTNHLVEGNWLENIKSSGVYTNNGGQSSVAGNGHDTEHVTIKDNTIVRSGLMGLVDNQKGAIAFNQYKDDLTIENNHVYGGQSYGIYFNPWGPASSISNVRIRNNEIAAVAGSAIVLNSNISMSNVEITDNDLFGNGTVGGSVNFNNSVLSGNVNITNNTVSGPVSNPTYANGFQVVPNQPVYTNPYAAIAAEPSQTGWAGVPSVNLADNEINVKNFGAKGDGATNDTLAFYAAIDAIPASGGTLRIPAGTYVLTPDPSKDSRPYSKIKHHLLLENRTNVHIVGDGDSSVLRFTSADHFGIRLLNLVDSSIRNVKMELANKPFMRHNRALLDITGSHNVVADHVTVTQSGGSGIQVDSSTGVSVQNSTVTDSNMSGVLIVASRQVYVENNTLKGNHDNAVFLNKQGSISRQSEYIRVAGNLIDGDGKSEQSGIAFASGDNVLATGNTIQNTHMAGVLLYYTSEVYPTDRITVTGNTLIRTNTGSNTLTYGAISSMMSKGGNFNITENTIRSTPYSGIWVKDSTLKSLALTANAFEDVGGKNIDIASDQLAAIPQYTANTDQITVHTKPERVQGGSGWGIAVTIRNLLALQPSTGGTVTVTNPTDWAQVSAPVSFDTIAPGQSTTVIVPIPAPLPANTGAIPFTLKIDQGGTLTTVTKTVNLLESLFTPVPVTIDGSATEWTNAGTTILNQASQVQFQNADWAGENDLSAMGYVMHDEQNVYLSVQVKDNIHSQTNMGSDIWRGDSLQLAIDTGRSVSAGQLGYTSELIFARTADNQYAQWRTTAPNGKTTGNQFSSQVSIGRDETNKTTTYEIAIPWSEILPNGVTTIPDRIGFAYLVNDDDGTGRRGWMEYMSGIGSSKNASLYGDLLLMQVPVPELPEVPEVPEVPTTSPSPIDSSVGIPVDTDKIEMTSTGVLLQPSEANREIVSENGTPVTHINVDEKLLNKALDALESDDNGNKTIIIKETKSSGLQLELSGIAAAYLEKQTDTVLSLQVGNQVMNVPASLLHFDQVKKNWGVKQEDLKVSFIVKPVSTDEMKQLKQQALADNVAITSDVIHFAIVVESGKNKQEINNFGNSYTVQRLVIPAIANFNNVTGVRIDPVTGEAVFAPTTFTVENGQTVATIHSNGSGIFAIAASYKNFEDMAGHWAQNDVTKLASKLLVQGVSETDFDPEAPVTRAQFAVLLSRSLGLTGNPDTQESFQDVQQSDWFYKQLGASLQAGLIDGYEDGTLKPNESVSREQMAVMIARAMQFMNVSSKAAATPSQQFTKGNVHEWAREAIQQCIAAGLMQGISENDFGATEGATRAQAAVTLARLLKYSNFIN